jgi:hypothetical protein
MTRFSSSFYKTDPPIDDLDVSDILTPVLSFLNNDNDYRLIIMIINDVVSIGDVITN